VAKRETRTARELSPEELANYQRRLGRPTRLSAARSAAAGHDPIDEMSPAVLAAELDRRAMVEALKVLRDGDEAQRLRVTVAILTKARKQSADTGENEFAAERKELQEFLAVMRDVPAPVAELETPTVGSVDLANLDAPDDGPAYVPQTVGNLDPWGA
jgi:hypothetical protein